MLVLARRVEHQVVEAELDVGPDLLDDLVGIARDDEAALRDARLLVGEPLELDRVVDVALLLG